MRNDNHDTENPHRREDDRNLMAAVMEAREMSIRADGKAEKALSRIDSHEDICAIRYAEIIAAVKGLNGKLYAIIVGVASSALVGMGGLVFLLLKNGAKL